MTAKSFGDYYIIYLIDDTPRTIKDDEYSSPSADIWKEVVQIEMDSIMYSGTWKVIECPYRCKLVECKWVFKKKLNPIRLGLWARVIPKKKGIVL